LKRKNLYLKWKDQFEIIELLNNGAIGVVPTETVYGIIGKPDLSKKINEIKKSSDNKPLTYFIGDLKQINNLWSNTPEAFSKTLKHWPGPFTLLADSPLIGIRMPAVPELCEILKTTGPLASTSANFSGEPTSSSLDNMPNELLNSVDFIIDESISSCFNQASTILKFEDNQVTTLRKGALDCKQLEVQG
jgi:L-threonylcarbamoyladenylate synthase